MNPFTRTKNKSMKKQVRPKTFRNIQSQKMKLSTKSDGEASHPKKHVFAAFVMLSVLLLNAPTYLEADTPLISSKTMEIESVQPMIPMKANQVSYLEWTLSSLFPFAKRAVPMPPPPQETETQTNSVFSEYGYACFFADEYNNGKIYVIEDPDKTPKSASDFDFVYQPNISLIVELVIFNDLLYLAYAGGDNLATYNPATDVVSIVNSSGDWGTANSPSTLKLDNMHGLNVDIFDNKVYGTGRYSSVSYIAQVDLTTGQFVNNGINGQDYLPLTITGSNPNGYIWGAPEDMAIEPCTGDVYIATDLKNSNGTDAGNDFLVKLPPGSGAATIITQLSQDVDGLAFDNDGNLYGVDDEFFFRINKTTGVIYEITEVVSSGNPDFEGVDCLINRAPIAVNDDNGETCINTSVVINVILNDVDNEDNMDLTTLEFDPTPPGWTVNVNTSNGHVTFTPPNNFTGTQTFQYQVCDNYDGCTPIEFCSPKATVTIEVVPDDLAMNLSQLPSCDTNCDGKIIVEPVNGTPPYEITYSGTASGTVTSSDAIIEIPNLCDGSYNITLQDGTATSAPEYVSGGTCDPVTGTQTVFEDCQEPFVFECDEGVRVDMITEGMYNQSTHTFNVVNLINDPEFDENFVTKMEVIAYYKGTSGFPNSVSFVVNGTTQTAYPQQDPGTKGATYYRTVFFFNSPTTVTTFTATPSSGTKIRSVVAYVFSEPTDYEGAFSGQLGQITSLYCCGSNTNDMINDGVPDDCVEETFSVPPAADTRDINFEFAFSEFTNDGRNSYVRLTPVGVPSYTPAEAWFNVQNAGHEAAIGEITMQDVPAYVTEIEVLVCSRGSAANPNGKNGQSAVYAGVFVDASETCLASCSTVLDPVIQPSCGEDNGSITVQVGGPDGDYTYTFTPPTGSPIVVTTSSKTQVYNDLAPGTYQLSVEGPFSCEDFFENITLENTQVGCNQPPVCNTITETAEFGSGNLTFNILNYVSDPDGQGDINLNSLSFSNISPSNAGTISSSGSTVTFTPDALFIGTVTFNYSIEDQAGETCNGTGSLTIKSTVIDGPDPETCSDNLLLATPCYVNGDPLAGGGSGTADAFVTFPYNSSGTAQGNSDVKKVAASEVGSVWGVAYKSSTKTVYTSAFLKRHVGYGPLGVGGIYAINNNTISSTLPVTQFLDLSTLGVNVGSDTRTATSPPMNDPNELAAEPGLPSWDQLAFGEVGKRSLGDLDISADESTLYTVNLFQKELVAINISGVNPTLAYKVTIPDPGCTGGTYRPFGLKVHDGVIYVGIVCSAETSQNTDDLWAHVMAYNGSTWESIFNFALDYPRGKVGGNQSEDAEWLPWHDTYSTISNEAQYGIYPQPILSDIEFDTDGAMILAFIDRNGHQVGANNYLPDSYPSTNSLTQAQTAGDILRVCNNNGCYELENNGDCDGLTTSLGGGSGQGPGGGEFYWGEVWDYNPFQPYSGYHQETSFGGLAFQPGTGEVALVAMNPNNNQANAGGIIWLSNTDGSRTKSSFQLYAGNAPSTGKANGLGDLEVFCQEEPQSQPPVCSLITGNVQKSEDFVFNILDYVTDPDGQGDINLNSLVFSNINPSNAGLFTQNGSTVTFNTSSTFVGTVTFNYTIADQAGFSCNGSGTIEVIDPCAGGFDLLTTKTDPTSGGGGNNGSIVADAQNGHPPYTYILSGDGSGTNSTGTFSNLSAGTYLVTAIDDEGCEEETSVVLNLICELDVEFTKTDVSCKGGDDGTATATAVDGLAPFTYTWSNGFVETTSGSSTATGLTAGPYTVNVVDALGCEKERTVTVLEPTDLLTSFTVQNATTVGGSEGEIHVSASGGTAPYTFTLTPDNITNSTGDFTGLTSGTYSVTVKDANDCEAVINSIIVSEPGCSVDVVVSSSQNVDCNGNSTGSATAVASGGNAPYTYEWKNSGGTVIGTNPSISNLAADTYTITVFSDNGNCSKSASIQITEPSVLTASIAVTNITCHGFDNGQLDLTVSGGTSPYTYNWSNISGTNNPQDQTDLEPGTYTVVVTDANGCQVTKTATVDEPDPIVINTLAENHPTAAGNDGSITVNAVGGTGVLIYNWNNGQTGPAATNLPEGTYIVTVTDVNGCVESKTFNLINPCTGGFTLATQKTDPTSSGGGNNGSITATASGGEAPYTYTLSGDGSGTNSTGVFNNLSAGTYTITAEDADGCEEVTSVVLNLICELDATFTKTDVSCNEGNDGSATATAVDGTAPFTFTWSNGTVETTSGTSTISGLVAGPYTVNVVDALGCEKERTVTITEPSAIVTSFNVEPATTVGGNEGEISVSASGGTAPYTFTLTPGNVTNSTGTFTGLTAGTYTVLVKDVNNCPVEISGIIVNEPGCDVEAAISSSTNVDCNGNSTGSATVVASGGNPPYTYEWKNSEGDVVGTDATINNLVAATYIATVFSDNGNCSSSASVQITQPSVLAAEIAVTDITCFGFDNGQVDLTVNGGTSPYTYDWGNLPGSNDPQDQTDLEPGIYNVLVTDANGCTVITSGEVEEPGPITITLVQLNQPSAANNDGSIEVAYSRWKRGFDCRLE